MKKRISAVFMVGLLSACSDQGSIGPAGSPIWFASTSVEQQSRYFTSVCQGYGYQAGTVGLRDCVATETRTQKATNKANMDEAMESFTPPPRPEPVRTRCNSYSHGQFGNSINCTTY